MADNKMIFGSHTIPTPVKDMQPGDEWWNNSVLDKQGPGFIHNDLIKMGRGRLPGEAVHQRPDDDSEATGSYANGGRVQKFGSSTHVTCNKKG